MSLMHKKIDIRIASESTAIYLILENENRNKKLSLTESQLLYATALIVSKPYVDNGHVPSREITSAVLCSSIGTVSLFPHSLSHEKLIFAEDYLGRNIVNLTMQLRTLFVYGLIHANPNVVMLETIKRKKLFIKSVQKAIKKRNRTSCYQQLLPLVKFCLSNDEFLSLVKSFDK